MTEEKQRERRRQENQDLVERMKRGEKISHFDAQASWFPPRPLIKKDAKAIASIYGSDCDGSK